MTTPKDRLKAKENFLIQYVLCRAYKIQDNSCGRVAAREAIAAWDIIENELEKKE